MVINKFKSLKRKVYLNKSRSIEKIEGINRETVAVDIAPLHRIFSIIRGVGRIHVWILAVDTSDG